MDFDWAFFWERLLSPDAVYLGALWTTIYIAVIAQLLGIAIGGVFALGRLSRFRILRTGAGLYVWFVRGIPVIVVMVLLFSGFSAAGVFRFDTIVVFGVAVAGGVQAAIVALALREGAYMAEIIRSGLQSVDPGQVEAAKALGLPWRKVMGRIVVPQATRVIVPPLGNQFILMIKTTSLASIIGVQELFLTSRTISAATFRVFEMFTIVALNYLLLTTLWSVIQAGIETRLARPEAADGKVGWKQRVAGFFTGEREIQGEA